MVRPRRCRSRSRGGGRGFVAALPSRPCRSRRRARWRPPRTCGAPGVCGTGVEVPVVAIVDERWGETSRSSESPSWRRVWWIFRRRRASSAVESTPKCAGLDRAGAHAEHADAARDVVGGVLARFEQLLEALAQRGDQLRQHAGLQVGDQLVHGEQRAQLLGVEPQARQLPERAVLDLVVEAVGLLLAVVEDRGVEAVAQVVEVALERGAGDFEVLAGIPGCARSGATSGGAGSGKSVRGVPWASVESGRVRRHPASPPHSGHSSISVGALANARRIITTAGWRGQRSRFERSTISTGNWLRCAISASPTRSRGDRTWRARDGRPQAAAILADVHFDAADQQVDQRGRAPRAAEIVGGHVMGDCMLNPCAGLGQPRAIQLRCID